MIREIDKDNFTRVIIEEIVIDDLYVLLYKGKTVRADRLYNQYTDAKLVKGSTTFNLRQAKTCVTKLNALFNTTDFSYRKI